MKYQKQEIKKGITLHNIETDKFKTNLIAIFLTTPISREFVTFNSLISSILRRGSKNMQTSEEISKIMEEMYGASFDSGVDKIGDNHILKFYLESINDEYIPHEEEKMLKESIEKIFEIVFNPYIENEMFKEEYLKQEKENMRQRIVGKIDNKAAYAKARCIEEMYKGEPAGLYRYGYTEDLNKINSKNLYEYYHTLINRCKIDIFVSGKIKNEETLRIIEENQNYKNLIERDAKYILNNIEEKPKVEEKIIEEKQDVTQGKIVIGCDICFNKEDLKDNNLKYEVLVYNNLLGGSANSKLFQNVREKSSLAYTVSSNYVRFKSNIFINAGIEIENFEKAINIIKDQLISMEKGEFTEEEIENAKKGIVSNINLIEDEQDSQIMYFYGQELIDSNDTIQDYKDNIKNVTREQILKIGSKININTVYFLRN